LLRGFSSFPTRRSSDLRLVCWGGFLIALCSCVGLAVRQLLHVVNPQFLARRLEQTVPDAKNSVINWLDLREEPLAPVIRGSLGRDRKSTRLNSSHDQIS